MADNGQADFWSGDVGRAWVRHERLLEEMTRDVSSRLLERAALRPGARVLEVGCGNGGLSLELARAVGPDGAVLGIDISGPLVARAEARRAEQGVGQLRFRVDDAASADLPEEAFDLIVSQFGAMFFPDPPGAFAHLRRAVRSGGRLLLATWGSAEENPQFAVAREVANRIWGPAPGGLPDGPGPFAMADPQAVGGLLAEAGFVGLEVERLRFAICGRSVEDMAELMSDLGPASARLRASGGGAGERAVLREALRDALGPFVTPEGVRMPALANLFEARRP